MSPIISAEPQGLTPEEKVIYSPAQKILTYFEHIFLVGV